MKDDNPHRKRTPLYYMQPSQAERDYEDKLHQPPPVRVSSSPPLLPNLPCVRAAEKITYDGEDELSDFPSIKVGNDAPLFSPNPGRSGSRPPGATQRGSQNPPLLRKSEASQSQRHRKLTTGLGNADILNTMNLAAPVQARSMLKRDFEFEDSVLERPLKKQRAASPGGKDIGSMQDEIASLKKVIGRMAADTHDIRNTLHELLREIQRKR